MKQLSRKEMKKVMGGEMSPIMSLCGSDRAAHADYNGSTYVNQGWGSCSEQAHPSPNCTDYCVRSDGSTYIPV